MNPHSLKSKLPLSQEQLLGKGKREIQCVRWAPGCPYCWERHRSPPADSSSFNKDPHPPPTAFLMGAGGSGRALDQLGCPTVEGKLGSKRASGIGE